MGSTNCHGIISTSVLTPNASWWLKDRKLICNVISDVIILTAMFYSKIADCYPNEIFPGRLWLGDWHHAKDAHVIETLKISHILNISDSCENYLAESHRKCCWLILNDFFSPHKILAPRSARYKRVTSWWRISINLRLYLQCDPA